MKSFKHLQAFLLAVSVHLLPLLSAHAKGNGVGFTMSGTLTNFDLSGGACQFTFTGTFHITEWKGASSSTVEILSTNGFTATVTQNQFFVATHPTVNAAAVRNDRKALANLLKIAAERGRVIKFELAEPKITFGERGQIKNLECSVVRATDWDLH
ncbi:MAG: hypothetical protein U1F65_12465 [Verrucomicrobiota bacterium]